MSSLEAVARREDRLVFLRALRQELSRALDAGVSDTARTNHVRELREIAREIAEILAADAPKEDGIGSLVPAPPAGGGTPAR